MVKVKKLRGIQKNQIDCDSETLAVIQYLCEESNNLFNCGVYWSRQIFFKTGRIVSKYDPIYAIGGNIHAQAMPSVAAQQTLLSVSEAFKSFRELRSLFFQGKLDQKPKPPDYRKKGGYFKVAFPNIGAGKPTLIDGMIRFPLGMQVKRWFGLKEFFLPMPKNLEFSKVKEFTIVPKNGAFHLECCYAVEEVKTNLDPSNAIGIDLGTSSNLMACVDTLGNSFLVDSRQSKAMNQLYNKRVANRKKGKAQDYWDSTLDRFTLKRNNQMRDMVNKSAMQIVKHCLAYNIGTVVIGWNDGIKDGANMGKQNNQQFVQMPLAKIKTRLEQLSLVYGFNLVQTEEANTSAASFLDGDSLPVHGKKPEGWKASGRRTKRGLYKTAQKFFVNADLNGAANILNKVARNLDLDLSRLGRRCLSTVGRIRLWLTPQSNSFPEESHAL
jgi:putative transposase